MAAADHSWRQVWWRFKRTRRAKLAATGITILAVFGLGIILVLNLPGLESRTLTGKIRCSSGARIVGVYVEVSAGDRSGFAHKEPEPGSAAISYVRTTRAKQYQLKVGCGGTRDVWRRNTYSSWLEKTPMDFVCFDRPTDKQYLNCVQSEL